VAPVMVMKEPAGAEAHTVWPVVEVKVPAMQATATVAPAPATKLPAGATGQDD